MRKTCFNFHNTEAKGWFISLGFNAKETPNIERAMDWEQNFGLKEFTLGFNSKVWKKNEVAQMWH